MNTEKNVFYYSLNTISVNLFTHLNRKIISPDLNFGTLTFDFGIKHNNITSEESYYIHVYENKILKYLSTDIKRNLISSNYLQKLLSATRKNNVIRKNNKIDKLVYNKRVTFSIILIPIWDEL